MPHVARVRVYLRLGRVSNLPTVWSNALAGAALGGGGARGGAVAAIAAALSLFYLAGMFLNDAFDRGVDARERPDRPIPAGEIRAGEVFGAGFALLAAGLAALAIAGSAASVASGAALAGAIVGYDVAHKRTRAAPLLMGLCRALVYATAALAAGGRVGALLLGGAALLFSWVVAISVASRRGASRRAVASMIAAIALIDAALVVAAGGSPLRAGLCAACAPATWLLQRWVRGT